MSSFKPGDWVRHIAFKSKHKCISINDGEFDDKVSVTNSHSFDNEFMIDYELWQPKVGEWCWFWDENYTTAILAKFENISNGLFVEYHGNIFDYCEPFIGQLPTHIKDQS